MILLRLCTSCARRRLLVSEESEFCYLLWVGGVGYELAGFSYLARLLNFAKLIPPGLSPVSDELATPLPKYACSLLAQLRLRQKTPSFLV